MRIRFDRLPLRRRRTIGQLIVLALALASPLIGGCTALDNFDKFTLGDGGGSVGGGGCSGGCPCIAADVSLSVPEHCYVPPANGATCPLMANAQKLVLSGNYVVDTNAMPPAMSGPGLTGNFTGTVQGPSAVFCMSSLVADSATKITVQGNRPLVLVAASLIQMSGVIRAGGAYASDDNGAPGVAGGAPGGPQGMPGMGPGGGHGGMSSAGGGTGGGGAGNAAVGFAGGGTSGASNTPGGDTIPIPSFGSGGGGGGIGSGKGGGGGGGGGVLQLSASWMIKLSNAGLETSGGGGAGGLAVMGGTAFRGGGGGGGGGAGGLIYLDAPTVSVTGGCLSVLGGPGGDGGGMAVNGRNTVQRSDCPFGGGPLGGIVTGAGGTGGFPSMNGGNGAGMAGMGVGGGGGGLASFGRVIVRAKTMPASLPGAIVFPNQPQAFQFLPMP